MLRALLTSVLVCTFVNGLFSQSPTAPSAAAKQAETEKQAVELLRETLAEVNQLRTPENRISFTSELASLMWFHNAREARVMYTAVITDFKQLMMQIDADANGPVIPEDDPIGPSLFGSGASKAERKLRIAMAVRQSIATSLAEHDADMAFAFFYETRGILTNPKLAGIAQQSDTYEETQLTQEVAKSDPVKAVEHSKRSLKAGVDSVHVQLLKALYSKDVDKAIEFGQAVLERSKSSPQQAFVIGNLLQFGDKNLQEAQKATDKKPVYTKDELRGIAETLASLILSDDEPASYLAYEYVDEIEKFAPGRAVQIRSKMESEAPRPTNTRYVGNRAMNVSMRPASSNANLITAEVSEASSEEVAAEQRSNAQKQLLEDVAGLSNKTLPKDERDKFVERSRKLIMSSGNKMNKITALSLLAAQVSRLGDRELADDIMTDAERLLPPQPKNYQDFMLTWFVISGYAEADPDKAFPLLNGAISRVNETLAAMIKIGEFIDVNDDFIEDGEAQIGAFGGTMVRGFTSELALVGTTATIRSLALADLKKTTAAANTFDRPEARVLAKILILRAVLDKTLQTARPTDGLEMSSIRR